MIKSYNNHLHILNNPGYGRSRNILNNHDMESVMNTQDLYFDHILILIIMFGFDIIIVYFGKFYMIK
jgi:hypothetical protein